MLSFLISTVLRKLKRKDQRDHPNLNELWQPSLNKLI